LLKFAERSRIRIGKEPMSGFSLDPGQERSFAAALTQRAKTSLIAGEEKTNVLHTERKRRCMQVFSPRSRAPRERKKDGS